MTAPEKLPTPANIEEFNRIVAVILAQLYAAFPVTVEKIDRDAIAEAFEIERGSWSSHVLPSGRTFNDVMSHTIWWLVHQNYMVASGSHPAERVVLSDKGLAALNAVPSQLSGSIGSQIVANTKSRNWTAIGDLIGSTVGSAAASYQKGITS